MNDVPEEDLEDWDEESRAKHEREARIEKECIEWVFGLTGGELDDKPLVAWKHADGDAEDWKRFPSSAHSEQYRFAYHYDGVPDYATEDFDDLYKFNVDYFTVVCAGGPPSSTLYIGGRVYRRAEVYSSSGESECPGRWGDGPGVQKVGQESWRKDWVNPPPEPERCPFCDADVGEEHGYIYIGCDWAEVVYRAEWESEDSPLGEAARRLELAARQFRREDNSRLAYACSAKARALENHYTWKGDDDE